MEKQIKNGLIAYIDTFEHYYFVLVTPELDIKVMYNCLDFPFFVGNRVEVEGKMFGECLLIAEKIKLIKD